MHAIRIDAACIGADHTLFDAIGGELALDALSYCDRCPVITECHDLIQPRRSYFDGVAAGRVWHNGKVIQPDALF
jgi:hypothetical protein